MTTNMGYSNTPPLLIKYTNLKWTKAEVTEEHSDALLYNVHYTMRKPHLRFMRPGTEEPFGTSTFHLTTRRIDMQLSGATTELKGRKWYSMDYQYVSPAFGNQNMSWKSKSHFKSYDYVLLNEQQIPVAKLVSVAGMSCKKIGRLEFSEGFVDSNGAKDEVVASAITLAYYVMQNMMAGVAAA